MASLQSKIFFGACCVVSAGIVYFVHKSQIDDRAALKQGIVRDLERQQMKKIENLKKLTDQRELEAAYRRQAAMADKVDR